MTTPPSLRALAREALAMRLSQDRRPILLGPWRSEVGFEALYWLPFLRSLASRVPGFWERALVVSRGGAANLYGQARPGETKEAPPTWWTPKAVDLYSLRTVTEIRRQNLFDWSKTQLQKQTRVTDYDRTLLREAAEAAGVTGRYHVVHPSWMYWALAPFWDEDRGLKYLFSMTDYQPLPKPLPPITIEGLPSAYVAVKFYGRATWPHPDPATMEFVAQMVQTIAAQAPVLLLSTGHDGDEHTDMSVTGKNIFLLPKLEPVHNLGVQLALLGRAQAFVGTYGGVAQAALRMGVPSASFWHQFGGTAHAHLSLSSWLSKRTNTPFVTGSMGDVGLWKQLLMVTQPMPEPGGLRPSSVAESVPA